MTMPLNEPCPWPLTDLDRAYHDTEWGVPQRDDHALFEMITLEGAQAGLSWSTILKKREGYRRAFRDFVPSAVAAFGDADIAQLLQDAGIVRHRGKITSTIGNARAVLEVQAKYGSLAAFIWKHVDDVPRQPARTTFRDIPSQSPESTALSKDLLAHGFRFVGPTTCYALMQAAGLVNDHLVTCPRWGIVQQIRP